MNEANGAGRRWAVATDGSCLGNPGPGGWGVVIRDEDSGQLVEISGGETETTNNRMELLAVLAALHYLKSAEVIEVRIRTDSEYITKGITERIHGWKRNGWRTADKKPVKNPDLWEQLDAATEAFPEGSLKWEWVKGHAGDAMNERADQLAKEAARKAEAKRDGQEDEAA